MNHVAVNQCQLGKRDALQFAANWAENCNGRKYKKGMNSSI